MSELEGRSPKRLKTDQAIESLHDVVGANTKRIERLVREMKEVKEDVKKIKGSIPPRA